MSNLYRERFKLWNIEAPIRFQLDESVWIETDENYSEYHRQQFNGLEIMFLFASMGQLEIGDFYKLLKTNTVINIVFDEADSYRIKAGHIALALSIGLDAEIIMGTGYNHKLDHFNYTGGGDFRAVKFAGIESNLIVLNRTYMNQIKDTFQFVKQAFKRKSVQEDTDESRLMNLYIGAVCVGIP